MPARRQPCCGLCPKGERLIDESQDGPRSFSERFCTDTLCLVPFFLTVLLVAIIGQIAITTGDPTSIRFGTDHTGRRCGVGEFENLPKIYFPKLGTELVAQRERWGDWDPVDNPATSHGLNSRAEYEAWRAASVGGSSSDS
jgi:hypothetical protein